MLPIIEETNIINHERVEFSLISVNPQSNGLISNVTEDYANVHMDALVSSISILKYMHNKKINTVYDANIILRSHGICNTENAAGSRVILSGYYNHGKHGKHGRNTPLLLISVSSVLSVVFKKFILDILWNRCTSSKNETLAYKKGA